MICYENIVKIIVDVTLFFHNTFIFSIVSLNMIFLLFYFSL